MALHNGFFFSLSLDYLKRTLNIKIFFFKLIYSVLVSTNVISAVAFSSGNALANDSSANSQVGITKIALLHVESIENSELMLSNSTQQTQSAVCLQSTGNDMPFRIRASSLSDNNQFSLKGDSSVIPYQVIWFNYNTWILDSADDQTGVLSATTTEKCALNTISIQMNNSAFSNASEGTYTDTLSLIIVPE